MHTTRHAPQMYEATTPKCKTIVQRTRARECGTGTIAPGGGTGGGTMLWSIAPGGGTGAARCWHKPIVECTISWLEEINAPSSPSRATQPCNADHLDLRTITKCNHRGVYQLMMMCTCTHIHTVRKMHMIMYVKACNDTEQSRPVCFCCRQHSQSKPFQEDVLNVGVARKFEQQC